MYKTHVYCYNISTCRVFWLLNQAFTSFWLPTGQRSNQTAEAKEEKIEMPTKKDIQLSGILRMTFVPIGFIPSFKSTKEMDTFPL